MSSATLSRPPWYRSTLAIALVGSVLMWLAMPGTCPIWLGWLGWFAPIPWLLLVRGEKLIGQRPYRALYLAGLVFWLLTIRWLRLPYPPPTWAGWIALSGYLAFYLPVFVGLSRVAVHRLGIPLLLVAPVVWTGLELARAHLLTGFLMASLAHTQVGWIALIQISDLFGEYGVDFLMMLVAAAITSVAVAPRGWWTIAPAAVAVGAALLYGKFRLAEATAAEANAAKSVRIALVQGNSLAEWKFDPSRGQQIMDEYRRLSERAAAMARQRDGRPVDLLVWPETMFRTHLISFDTDYELPPNAPRTKDAIAGYGPKDLASLAALVNCPVLAGIDRVHFRSPAQPAGDPLPARRYNSAALVDRDGNLVGTYDKIHRVMFGEYIPFAEHLPFLYRLTPLTGGIDAGREPVVFDLHDSRYAPSICYETVIPHVIRRQARATANDNKPADILINMTNDAWYWGASELDQHLACGVFRAVESRRPLVIAANGGISAWIDRTGQIRAQSPRQQPDIILADVELGSMHSPYVQFGDWFAAACLICCIALAIIGTKKRGKEDTKTRDDGA